MQATLPAAASTMSAIIKYPTALDSRHPFMSSFPTFTVGMQQPYMATATPAPLLIQGLTPNGLSSQPTAMAIFHPTPAITVASTPFSAVPSLTAASVYGSAPPSSLSSLRTRRESRPAKPPRGTAEVLCPEKGCGMRFASDESLVEHITRLHINNRDIYRKPHMAAVAVQPAVQVTYARPYKRRVNGTLQQTAAGKDTSKSSTPTRGKRGQGKGETERGGKRPHAATSGGKVMRRKQQSGGENKRRDELDFDGDVTDDDSQSSDMSDISSDDSDDSLDSDDDSISDSDDDSGSSDDDDVKGGRFEVFGRAMSSSSSSSSSDADSSTDSSPRRTRRGFTSRRPPTSRPPRSARSSLSSTTDPSPSSSSPSVHPTASRDPRLDRIRALNYLFKFRQPSATPVSLLRCALCNTGLHPNLGLLQQCHGGCGLSFHQHCIEMWTVPSGPWYCSDECVREECRVKDELSDDGRVDTDLKYLQVCRRWQNWFFKKKKRLQLGTVSNREPKQRFIVPLICTVPRCPSFPSESKWADAFPPARLPAAPLVRRLFHPLSLSARPNAYTNSTSSIELSEQAEQSSASLGVEQLHTATSTAAGTNTAPNGLSNEAPRPRRPHHLMFSLKQPRSDPTDFVPTYPGRYAAKGQKQLTSSRSLRTSHSSLRSSAFLLSLRVPDRDPNIAICCVCENGDSIDDNPIILCDGPCCMAYHRHCVGLSHMPKEEDVWCCSDVCKRARAKNNAVEDDVVVRLVQRRRDEYDARGPYRGLYDEGKGGEAANAELLEQFAQLDGQYFCPRVMTRLWRKGKWRLQQIELPSMLEVMEVVGEVSGKWRVRVEEDGEGMDGKVMQAEEWIEFVQEEPPVPTTDTIGQSVQSEETKMADGLVVAAAAVMLIDTAVSAEAAVAATLADGLMHVEDGTVAANGPTVELASVSAPSSPAATADATSVLFRSSSSPAALPSASTRTLCDTPAAIETDAASLDFINPTPLPPTTAVPLPLSVAPTHPLRTVSDSTAPSHTSDHDTSDVLTEEQRLLASYYTQVLANNQTKSCLLAAFHAHKLVNPTTLPTLTSQQQADEVTIQTYLEYEEKHAVGSEKDRVRRQQKCHVNYCRCHACFNAHLVVEDEDQGSEEEGEDERDREVEVDEVGEVMDESQLYVEEDEAEVRVEEQPAVASTAVSSASSAPSTAFTLPPALRSLTGTIHPSALIRFVDHCLRHRDEYLALAKSVSSAEVALLLEAGGRGARTFTRQQLRAKRDEESGESSSRQRTRRRSSLFHDESSPSPPPTDSAGRTNTELMSLQKWGWDRTWRQRLEAGLTTDPHVTRSRGRANAAGMGMDEEAMGAAGGVLPRGHARLRIVFRGKGVFTSRDSEYDDHRLPVVRFKPRSQHRSAAQSLKLKFKRAGSGMTATDGNGGSWAGDSMRGMGRDRVVVRFLLGNAIRVQTYLGGRVGGALRRLHAGWFDKRSQQQQQLEPSAAVEAISEPMVDMSATEAMSHAAALATEMVQRLQALQQEPPPLTAEEKKQLQREKERIKKIAEKEKRERSRLQSQQQSQRAKQLRGRQVNVWCQVLADGDVVVQTLINPRYKWASGIGRTEVDRLTNAWPQWTTVTSLPTLYLATASADEGGATVQQHSTGVPDLEHTDVTAEANGGEGRLHRTRHFTRRRQLPQNVVEQAVNDASDTGDASSTIAASSLHTLPLGPTYSRKGQPRASDLPPTPASSAAAVASFAEPVQYVMDVNGLPIITDPIPDDICQMCGYSGDVLLCDGTIDGISCVRCYHLHHLHPPLEKTPEGEWSCPHHFCSACAAQDTDRSKWPFTYCEWCDKSWCGTCAADESITGVLVEWTPKAATEQARWVCCQQCVKYYRTTHKMKDGDDFRAPQRQLRAHEQKVKGQLVAHKKVRKEQERQRREAEAQQTKRSKGRKAQAGGSERKRRSAAQPSAETKKRRKSESAAVQTNQQLDEDEDTQPLRSRRSGRATKRRVEQVEQDWQGWDGVTVKLKGENGQARTEDENVQFQTDEDEATNAVHMNGTTPASARSTVSEMHSPPPLVLQPCISRREQSSTRRQLHHTGRSHSQTPTASAEGGRDEGEETDEETPTLAVDDSPLALKSRRTARRRSGVRGAAGDKQATAMNGLNGHARPIVTVPSPSSLASLPCLSTSSSASTITSTSSSPIPLPGTPDSAGSDAGGRSSLQLLSPPSPRPMHADSAADDSSSSSSSRRVSTRRGNAIEFADDRKMALALERQLNSWTQRPGKLPVTPKKRASASPAKGDKLQADDVDAEEGVAVLAGVNGAGGMGGARSAKTGSKRLRMR